MYKHIQQDYAKSLFYKYTLTYDEIHVKEGL